MLCVIANAFDMASRRRAISFFLRIGALRAAAADYLFHRAVALLFMLLRRASALSATTPGDDDAIHGFRHGLRISVYPSPRARSPPLPRQPTFPATSRANAPPKYYAVTFHFFRRTQTLSSPFYFHYTSLSLDTSTIILSFGCYFLYHLKMLPLSFIYIHTKMVTSYTIFTHFYYRFDDY